MLRRWRCSAPCLPGLSYQSRTLMWLSSELTTILFRPYTGKKTTLWRLFVPIFMNQSYMNLNECRLEEVLLERVASSVQVIPKAKVPILKYVDSFSGVSILIYEWPILMKIVNPFLFLLKHILWPLSAMLTSLLTSHTALGTQGISTVSSTLVQLSVHSRERRYHMTCCSFISHFQIIQNG